MVIFVFGSNTKGRHGRGAALTARKFHKAEYGVGRGLTGHSYALPTKGDTMNSLKLSEIRENVDEFIRFAKANPNMHFMVTKVGCGLAGYASHQIAPMFANAPDNCVFDRDWQPFLEGKKFYYRT